MIVAALCIALGGVTFEKVDIPDVYISAQIANFRHADLDDDGHMDLLMPTRVYLRPDGQLDPTRFISMPDVDEEARVDVWNQTLFAQSATSLTAYELLDGSWNQTRRIDHEQNPVLQYVSSFAPETEPPLLAFDRFLHDIDGDGEPEIVRVDDTGISVSVIDADQLTTSHLDLYPPPRLLPYAGYDTLWPQTERRIAFPNRKATFRIAIEHDVATMVERFRQTGGGFAFRIERYRIAHDADKGFTLNHESSHQTGVMPYSASFPLLLNGDDTLDYFGSVHDGFTYTNWAPIGRGFASTDGGITFQMAAVHGFYTRAMFVDLDGDGDKDWIGEESGLVAGGLRETANRALFQRKFTHTLRARMQNNDGVFEPKWQTLGRFTMRFDEPPRDLSYRFWQYRMGDLIDCTGDFNGDGWKDVLVSDTPGTVSLYLGGPKGFETRAETSVGIPPDTMPVALDLDGDGRSDLAVVKRDNRAALELYLNAERT